jgi:hypothetical protein
LLFHLRAAVPQDLPDQAEAGQEAAPEPPHPLLDPHAHRQHHQVRRPHRSPPSCFASTPWRRRPVFRSLIRILVFCESGTTRSAGTGAAPSSDSERGKRCWSPMLGEAGGLTSWPRHTFLSPQARQLLLRFWFLLKWSFQLCL